MEQYEQLKIQLEEQLFLISKETTSLSLQAKQSIPICQKALQDLKIRINKSPFHSKKEEIFFFKEFKPQIAGKLIYFVLVFNIETLKPSGTEKQLKKYFCNHLKIMNLFKKENASFYQYYRSNGTFLDEKYFIRNQSDLHLALDHNASNYDTTFNTSHDQKVAQIIAYDFLLEYLHDQLNKTEQNLFSEISKTIPVSKLKWTDNKNSLIELIYALQATGSFNNGKADVKEIAAFFETAFDTNLGDLYRNYHELRYRKVNRTKYIDTLKENIIKRMDTIDEKSN